ARHFAAYGGAAPPEDVPRQGRLTGDQAGETRGWGQADRSLFLADPERLEDHDHARGVRASLHHRSGRYFQGRSVQAAVPGDLSKQPDAGDHRSPGPGRQADLDLRVRRHLAISRPQDGKFYPRDERGRVEVDQWLFWQMANLGPKAGEANHFRHYASEKLPYAIERFGNEMNRIYGVMNRRLSDREFLAGKYSIADIACIGWASRAERHGYDLSVFANVRRWLETVLARPA